MLAFRLDENQRTFGDIDMTLADFLGPVFTHLGGRRDRIGAGGVAGLALAHDHRGVAVHGGAHARIFETGFGLLAGKQACARQAARLVGRCSRGLLCSAGRGIFQFYDCAHARLPVANGSWLMILRAWPPLTTPCLRSNQTMAPVGQRSMAMRASGVALV